MAYVVYFDEPVNTNSGLSARGSQFIIADTAAELPTAPEGSRGYAKDTQLFYYRNATVWTTPGGASTENVGETTIDFGAFPGASDASTTVTGQTGIVSGSKIMAWLYPKATADHSADEHILETIRIYAGNIVAGTGFTIYGVNSSQLNEPVADHPRDSSGGRGTRIYGTWTVQWKWV